MRHDDASSSGSEDEQSPRNRPSFSANRLNSRNSSFAGNSYDGYGRRRWRPLNLGSWIYAELVATVSYIIVSIFIAYCGSESPSFAWIVGYASGSVVTLPLLCWCVEQNSYSHQGSCRGDRSKFTPYIAISVTQATGSTQVATTLKTRLTALVDIFVTDLYCFLPVWFVVATLMIFRGGASPSNAPCRLYIEFFISNLIGCLEQFLICATTFCCLPCIRYICGDTEDFPPPKGATTESINALPTYKLKSKKATNDEEDSADEGAVLAAGTAEERVISGEDASCCICWMDYVDDDELRELPCDHVFHVECIDRWLKINETCPLCTSEISNPRLYIAWAIHI